MKYFMTILSVFFVSFVIIGNSVFAGDLLPGYDASNSPEAQMFRQAEQTSRDITKYGTTGFNYKKQYWEKAADSASQAYNNDISVREQVNSYNKENDHHHLVIIYEDGNGNRKAGIADTSQTNDYIYMDGGKYRNY